MAKLQCHTCTHTVYLHECTCYVDYMFIGILVIGREVGKEGGKREGGREREREREALTVVPVFDCLSLPAKSTRLSLPTLM